jgi:hypothetical protein
MRNFERRTNHRVVEALAELFAIDPDPEASKLGDRLDEAEI